MKKVFVSFIIAVTVILAVFATGTLAVPPDNPKTDWTEIKDGVDTLLGNVANLQTSVDSLPSGINMMINAFSNAATFATPSSYTTYEIPMGGPYDYGNQVRHVSLTIHTDDLQGSDRIAVHAVINSNDYTGGFTNEETRIIIYEPADFEGIETTQTIEFNAVLWYITYYHHLGVFDPVRISYSAVETYQE